MLEKRPFLSTEQLTFSRPSPLLPESLQGHKKLLAFIKHFHRDDVNINIGIGIMVTVLALLTNKCAWFSLDGLLGRHRAKKAVAPEA